jgi:hypothetical protein
VKERYTDDRHKYFSQRIKAFGERETHSPRFKTKKFINYEHGAPKNVNVKKVYIKML